MTHQVKSGPQGLAMSRDKIREIFLAHGFTVKEGQTDLKPYVYEAAEALLAAATPAPIAQAQGDEAVKVEGALIYKLNDQGHNEWSAWVQPGWKSDGTRMTNDECAQIAAYLASRPSAPVAQEPVAWRYKPTGSDRWLLITAPQHMGGLSHIRGVVPEPLYAAPAPQPGMGAGEYAQLYAAALRKRIAYELRERKNRLPEDIANLLDDCCSAFSLQLQQQGPMVAEVEAPEIVYRWLALDHTGYCYGSNPPDNLPDRCCLKAFYSQPDYALATLHEIAHSKNLTATPQQFADHLQREAKRALARQLSEAQVADGRPVAWRVVSNEDQQIHIRTIYFEAEQVAASLRGARIEPLIVGAVKHDALAALPAQPQEQSAPRPPVEDWTCLICDGGPGNYCGCVCPDGPHRSDQSAPAAGESGKPSWKDAPEWAQWLAQDAYGCWHWYAAEPRQGRDCLWFAPLENAKETAAFRPNPNWRNTLEQRPAQAAEGGDA